MGKHIASLCLAVLVAVLLAAPAGAAPRFKTLGTDVELDAPPSFDLTELAVRKVKKDLEIKIGINLMTPPWGSALPLLPGVQWAFDVKGRTFVAEAYTNPPGPAGFLLFEKKDDTFTQIMDLEGTYEWQNDYVSMKVPLKAIGARKGTRISGTGKKGTDDVDFHIHFGPRTEYADKLATTKDFVVP